VLYKSTFCLPLTSLAFNVLLLFCQIDVKEARKMVESHPQWDFQDDEDEEEKKDEDVDSESNISSDDEMSDDY